MKSIKITEKDYKFLKILKSATGMPMTQTINKALLQYAPEVPKKLIERTRKSIGG